MKSVNSEKVLQTISNATGLVISKDQMEENLSDLGMDSIMFIKNIVALEEEFECEIPDSKLFFSEMDTVKKIVDILISLYDFENRKPT